MIRLLLACAFLLPLAGLLAGAEGGHIQVVAPPGVQILLDSTLKGVTSSDAGGLIIEDVPAGSHALQALKTGYVTQRLQVEVRPGKVSKVELATLRPKVEIREQGREGGKDAQAAPASGILVIESQPVECVIDMPGSGLDQQRKTMETLTAKGVPVGTYPGRFTAQGKTLNAEVAIEKDGTTRVFLNFAKGAVEVQTPAKPVKPAWAAEVVKDEYGFAADLVVGGVTQRMRWMGPGTFLMGSPPTEAGRMANEIQHPVTLTRDFWFADSACTQAMWQAVMGNNPSHFTGDPHLPVEKVSWDDCQLFFQVINGQVPGLKASLPTEAQREYACRAGTTGEYAGDLEAMAWYQKNSADATHPVKAKAPNAWGLYDLHGNLWEWCADAYGDYPSVLSRDPTGPAAGTAPPPPPGPAGNPAAGLNRVRRGGSWNSNAPACRSAYRNRDLPSHRCNYLGFRIAAQSSAPPR